MFEERKYLIIKSSEIDKSALEQLIGISRVSNDQTKFVIKWDNESPGFVSNLVDTEGPYNKEEILQILNNPEWQNFTLLPQDENGSSGT